jgi:bacterioferritin (cytochrome b1)
MWVHPRDMADPDPMDVSAVLNSLNEALRLRYRSAMQYLVVSGGGRGLHALAIGEQLWTYAQAEFADARLLISKVVALGGQPDVDVAAVCYASTIDDGLKHLICIEEEAMAALHQVIPETGQEPGSEALEHLIEHVIMRKQEPGRLPHTRLGDVDLRAARDRSPCRSCIRAHAVAGSMRRSRSPWTITNLAGAVSSDDPCARAKQESMLGRSRRPDVVRRGHEIGGDTGFRSPWQSGRRGRPWR